jgi:hypothetical protein
MNNTIFFIQVYEYHANTNKEIGNPTNRSQQIVLSAFERVKKLIQIQPELHDLSPEDATEYHRILGKRQKRDTSPMFANVFKELGELAQQSHEVHHILNPTKAITWNDSDF